ncbi:MAG: hypothetical protein ACKVTZ_16410 [Bacteroidia bacterium]
MNPIQNPGQRPNNGQGNDQTKNIILAVVGVILLAALGFFAAKYFSTKGDLTSEQQKTEELSSEIDSLDKKIQTLESDITTLNQQSQGKDSIIASQATQIEAKVSELSGLQSRLKELKSQGKISDERARSLENRMSLLQTQISQYEAQLAKLRGENEGLVKTVGEKEGVIKEKEGVIMEKEGVIKEKEGVIQEKDKKIESTIREKEEVVAQKDQEIGNKTQLLEQKNKEFLQKKEELNKTTETASVLRAADFRYLNVKKNDKQKEEYDRTFNLGLFGTGVQDVNVCFTVQENAISKPGARDLYLVYKNPDGSVRKTAGSGKFNYNNQSMDYTLKTTINYNRAAQEVCMRVPKPADKAAKYQKGNQAVSVYCDNNLIGSGGFGIK